MFEFTIDIEITYDDANVLYNVYERKLADIGWQAVFGTSPIESVYSFEDVRVIQAAWEAMNQALIASSDLMPVAM